MLDKCANPGCAATFLKLRDGKLFVIEIEVETANPSDGGRRARKLLHYWLCNSCCRTLTVMVGKGKTVQIVRSPAPPTEARTAS